MSKDMKRARKVSFERKELPGFDGVLYVLIGEERVAAGIRTPFRGERTADLSGKARFIHVISIPAGGEIRGYVQKTVLVPAHTAGLRL